MLKIMKNYFSAISLTLGFALLLLIFGCSSPEVKVLPPLPETSEFIQNAATVKTSFDTLKNTVAFISSDTYDVYRHAPQELARRMKMVGIKQCFLILSEHTPKHLGENDLRQLIVALKQQKISFCLAFDPRSFYNQGQRWLVRPQNVDKNSKLFSQINQFMTFNDASEPDAKFNGIAIILAPQLMRSSTKNNHLYAWSEKNYGVGLDNDKLTVAAVQLSKKITQLVKPLKFTVIIPDFIHIKATEGKLSTGRVEDFAGFTDQLIVMAFAPSLKETLAKISQHAEVAATLDLELIPCILAHNDHYREITDSICNRSFADFATDLQTTMPEFIDDRGIDGIAVIYWRGLEILLEKFN